MKYILIENSDGNDPKKVSIFLSSASRAKYTRELILADDYESPCPELIRLENDGIVTFEGDPSLEWIDAEVFIEPEAGAKLTNTF